MLLSFLVKSNINLTGVIWGLYKDVFTIIRAEENEALDNVWQNKPVTAAAQEVQFNGHWRV